MVDQVLEWTPGESIKGIKNVAMSEDVLEFHFPKNPIFPGVLLLESMTQLAGWLEAISSDFETWFLLKTVKKCSFYGFAFPGDQVDLEITFSSCAGDLKSYKGIGKVHNSKIIAAEFTGTLIPLKEIEDPLEHKNFFKHLTRDFLK
jgi:3-hydroxymyristoyl/3-hydroxydecanoyl-(acyl carrier protein) dehydratase